MAQEIQDVKSPPSVPNLLEGDEKFTSLAAQFFLIPMGIAIIAVGIFVGIRMMTGEEKDPIALVRELRLQTGSARWQAAYDLDSRLVRDPAARKDPRLVPEIIKVYGEIPPGTVEDQQTRTCLIVILGMLRDPQSLAVLIPASRDKDGGVRVAAIQALGSVGEPSVVPDLLETAADEDAGLRKAAIFALGLYSPRRRAADKMPALDDSVANNIHAALRKALKDLVEDVRWNAALALARFGDAEAAPTLRSMMDREYLKQFQVSSGIQMPEEQVADVVVNAMKGAVELHDESFRPAMESIARSDPSMEVRQAARIAVDALK